MLGNLSKALPEDVFQYIINHEDNQRYRLAYMTQAYLALRISELMQIHKKDINTHNCSITIFADKNDQYYTLPIPQFLCIDLLDYIQNLKDHDKVFPSKTLYKNRLRKILEKSGKQLYYARSEDGRVLPLYSSHSLRAYGITWFYYESGKDIELTRQFARHKDLEKTSLYIERNENKIRDIVNNFQL